MHYDHTKYSWFRSIMNSDLSDVTVFRRIVQHSVVDPGAAEMDALPFTRTEPHVAHTVPRSKATAEAT
jgi:hypothetical protein